MGFQFTQWVCYFKENKLNLHKLDWNDPYQLTTYEYQTIYKSIQQFQIGESSEGKFLMGSAKRYLSKENDKFYLQALILFIQEEQRHAKQLSLFMEKEHIPTIKKHWIDQVFRKLRRFANLEQSITVLLTAEIIATVYYDAIRHVTKSKILIDICQQILSDEAKHVEFQSVTLSEISNNRSFALNIAIKLIREILLFGTLMIVWLYHKKVFKAGGYTFFRYVRCAFDEHKRSESIIKYGI